MIFLSQLIQVMSEKYYFLKMLNSENELLKYFIVDEEGFFTPSPIAEIKDEFIDRFRGDTPKKRKYQDVLFFSCFRNYISSLEKEINSAERMN